MSPGPLEMLESLTTETDAAIVQSPQWYRQLREAISGLIQHDFDKLVQILYRADVDEFKLKAMLKQEVNADSASIIANLLVERQLQKIASRHIFRQNEDISPDEKW